MEVSLKGLITLIYLYKACSLTIHFFYLVSNEKMARTDRITLRDQLYNARYAQRPSVVLHSCVT